MQDNSMSNRLVVFLIFCFISFSLIAQVNTVDFGKNRLQFKKFTWKFYQSPNFNTYFNQGGLELGKYVTQVAEQELPGIEKDVEYALQKQINIVVYNSYDDYKSTNIGLGNEIFNTGGGVTKMVNNKLVVYFDGNHAHLKRQIRQGIAKVLLDNQLFGEDIGEFASNQALLDLPEWLTDGYVSYIGENWSTEKDDELKSIMLSDSYKNFYQFAYEKPVVAGHAFWYYIEEKYKKENVTYLLYLARIYKSLNNASLRITKKKFKEVLKDFMTYEQDKYYKDIRGRRNVPKGTVSVTEEITNRTDFFRFQANPNPRNQSYVVAKYNKGKYTVGFYENYELSATLVKYGVRMLKTEINPTYPVMAWDGKGGRVAVIYSDEGKIKMFIYDAIARYKNFKQEIEGLDQVVDVQFLLDKNTLLLTGTKNGHTDIFIYKVDTKKLEQLTNDVYDDLDASFVSFPNKTGIIFASNRPSPSAPTADTAIPTKNRYNIFLLDYLTKQQITQLTNLKFGNARYPMQYNTNHFTYVSDENGIANRWAGFFTTEREGLDTLFYIGDEVLRNPSDKELDSTMVAWQKNEPDSISTFQVTKDSTYTFPLTNYQSSLLETRIAGDKGQVSEVTRQGDYKFLYKLKVDSSLLRKRNINARPTEYMKKLLAEKRFQEGKSVIDTTEKISTTKGGNVFQSEFENDAKDTSSISISAPQEIEKSILQQSKLYNYKYKFSTENVTAGFSNNIIINRYQLYANGTGPIRLGNGAGLNLTFRSNVSDLMEDIKFIGGFRLGTNLKDNDYLFSFQNLRKRLDWGATFYRTSTNVSINLFGQGVNQINQGKLISSIYQFNVSYPFDEVKSLRAIISYRRDNTIIKPVQIFELAPPYPDVIGLAVNDPVSQYALGRLEYVHDNTINPMMNIWHGLRYKIYSDISMPISEGNKPLKSIFNFGFDARNYVSIYRNFIWATRVGADFSWGEQKLIYYLGGVDGWFYPKFIDQNRPDPDQSYAFQTLAVNLRGFNQNIANGNNAFVFNSELRLPVFSTLLNKPVNNAFIRNFQVIQFVDLGTAWNGKYDKFERPTTTYSPDPAENGNPLLFKTKAGGIGPLAGGYGFGMRSTLLGYFLKLDAGWPMNGIFRGKPIYYFALGLDF